MKKLIVIGLVAMVVLSASGAFAAIDNDWKVYLRASTDNLAKSGASTANYGLKTGTPDTFANLTTSPNLAGSPEINYTDGAHPYTTSYGATPGRTYVATFGGAPLGLSPKTPVIDWKIKACGAGNATIYVTAWEQTGTTNSIEAGLQKIQLFESNAQGEKLGAAVWTFLPAVNTTYSGTTGIAGTKGTDFWQKSYTLGAADASGGAFQYFLLEATVPEPGSMVALFSGLVGLIGFGIRRRK